MSSYNTSPIATISGSGKKNNGGTIVNGAPVSSLWNNLPQTTNSRGTVGKFTGVYANWNNGVSGLLQSAGAALTSAITQSASTGYCNVNITSHGLVVGQMLIVIGTDIVKYNQIHRVTVVTDANNVKTDVPFTTNASTVGTYKTVSGNFATMTKNQYVGMIVGAQVAGVANTILRSPSAEYFRVPYGVAQGNYRYNITSWDYVTGRATYGGSRGAAVLYHDIAGNNDSLAFEPFPTKAVPGHLVYFTSARDLATVTTYKARQE